MKFVWKTLGERRYYCRRHHRGRRRRHHRKQKHKKYELLNAKLYLPNFKQVIFILL